MTANVIYWTFLLVLCLTNLLFSGFRVVLLITTNTILPESTKNKIDYRKQKDFAIIFKNIKI